MASLSTLIAVVVVIPAVLIEVGGIPFSRGGLGQLSRSFFAGRAADPGLAIGWVAGSALVLAWLLWAWMAVCIAVELRSWATGRTRTRLPASRTAQSVAAFLVGTALAVSLGRGVSVPHPRAPAAEMRLTPKGLSDPTDSDVVSIDDLLMAVGGQSGLTQRAGPAPSGLAVGPLLARQLGRTGGSAKPASGSGLPSESSGGTDRSLRGLPKGPGSPSDLTGSAAAVVNWLPPVGSASETVDALVVPRTHLVRSRETLWSIAEDELGSALRWQELAEMNYGVTQEDGWALDRDHWIRPGWRLLLPPWIPSASGTPMPSAPRRAGPSVLDSRESGPGADLPQPGTGRHSQELEIHRGTPSNSGHDIGTDGGAVAGIGTGAGPDSGLTPNRGPALPVVPVGAGVVGAGVVRLLDRMRRAQQRHRTEGGLIRLPDAPGRRFEQRLRVGEGWEVTREVDAAIRNLGSVRGLDGEFPRVLGVRVHSEAIEVVVADTDELPRVERNTVSSTRQPEPLPEDGAPPRDRHHAVAPLMATVGTGPSGLVMVNLESIGSLMVSGSSADADGVVRALALELATSFWSGQFSVAVVGFGSELERFEGVRSYANSTELVHRLVRRRINGAALLRDGPYRSFADARRVEPGDRWAPLVVICGPDVEEEDVVEIVEMAADPVHGTTVIGVGERVEAQYAVRVTGGDWADSLELLGAAVFPQRVGSEEMSAVRALLDTAASRGSVSPVRGSVCEPSHTDATRGGR